MPTKIDAPAPVKNNSLFDRLAIGAIAAYGAVVAFALLLVPTFYMPAEDSVILFLFSRNLAWHGAITFIPFGPHAEGATDFLWMVLIALGMKLGMEPFWVAAIINFASIFLLGYILSRIAGYRVSPLLLCFTAGAFGLLPQFAAAAMGFSVLPFACLISLLALCFLRQSDVMLPLVGLTLCLFRPDGVVFAIPMMIAAIIAYPNRGRRLALDIALFVVPGLSYFLWRWHYFGQLLPLPFLVKSNAIRFAHVLVVYSVIDSSHLLIFTIILLAIILAGRMKDKQNRAILLCLIILPNLFYFAMRLDQNVGLRFFIYLPIGMAVLLAMNWRAMQLRRSLFLRVALACWLLLVFNRTAREIHLSWGAQYTNRKAIATDLAKSPSGILLSTEAGVIPYYSGWTTYDSWGLNTEQFAKHLFQPEDVAKINPDIVMLHTGDQPAECVADPSWQTPYQIRDWHNMTRNLIVGSDPEHYELWLAPLGHAKEYATRSMKPWEGDQDCWLVRRNSPLRQSIEAALTRHGGVAPGANSENGQITSSAERARQAAQGKVQDQAEPHGLKARLTRLWHALN